MVKKIATWISNYQQCGIATKKTRSWTWRNWSVQLENAIGSFGEKHNLQRSRINEFPKSSVFIVIRTNQLDDTKRISNQFRTRIPIADPCIASPSCNHQRFQQTAGFKAILWGNSTLRCRVVLAEDHGESGGLNPNKGHEHENLNFLHDSEPFTNVIV